MATPSDRTYYAVLGLSRDATAKQVKDAYRRAARSTHPDAGGSAEQFHDVAVAYETLADPERRRRYDQGLGGSATGRDKPAPRPPSRTSATAPGAPAGDDEAFQRPAVYEPPFSPQQPPVIPLTLAGSQVHGTARQPGFLARLGSNGGSRYDGERRTSALLEHHFLQGFPAARLVNGLRFGDDAGTEAGHAVLAGYRLAVIDSLLAPPGNYRWDGAALRRNGKIAGEVRIIESVRRVQDLFPECNVQAWLVLHGAEGNPFEPIVDYPPSLDKSAVTAVHVANPGTLLRELRKFLGGGPQPYVVQLPVLGRLLKYAER
ncbi:MULTISPECIES: J domain-containing protein [unclassified Arthrobacter]|uniref:J domain-containing protein n=1 Tax=unclassified Arthrobacter TaxID=235627 RepID=UPI0014915D3D|nr:MULTISPECIES: J domain-containing protein [unclassified Arthrobacter]MBE0008705.1 molecular chaperone DnaJ [Arthrobacter sp. AET 35A]NOJ62538.1 J domain-containing protein [Arthrobacter sp. 147(2020)]